MYDFKKHLAALAASNWPAWKAGLAGDVIYDEVPTRIRAKGADEYVKVIQRWKRAFPDLAATIVTTASAGDTLFAEVEWTGTQTGPLEGPVGTIAPTNKGGVLRAVMIVTLANDKIVEVHHYFDVVTMLSNLGIAPFAGVPTQAERPADAAARRH